MADTFNKKEREKKKQRKKREKELRKEERKAQGKQTEVIMFVDHNGNFTENKPEHIPMDDEELLDLEGDDGNDSSSAAEFKGTVKFYDESKGFGFIKTSGKIGDVFFHIDNAFKDITEGVRVSFTLEKGEKGYQAFNISKS